MKTKCFLISALALFTGFSFVSCSDDDKPELPIFPNEIEEITLAPNETKDIDFTANLAWKATIVDGATWLTFVNGEAEIGLTEQGEAGDVSLEIKAKDTDLTFDEKVAEIKLTMGEKSEVIYKVTRTGKERIVQLLISNKPAEKIDLKYQSGASNKVTIGFIANYDWVISLPDVAELSAETLTGEAAEYAEGDKAKTTARISIKKEFAAFAYTGEIGIKDLKSDYEYKIPLVYTGMGENDFSINTNNRFSQWEGIKFTQEGKFIEQKGSMEKETEDKNVSFSVLAKDMKYSSFLYKMNDKKEPVLIKATDADSWISLEEKDGTIKVEAKGANTDAPRELFLLLLPEKAATEVVLTNYFENGAITKGNGAENVIKISQKGVVVAQGFNLQWGVKGAIDAGNITDGSHLIGVVGNGAPANNTYMFGFTDAMLEGAGALQIFPNGWQAGPSIGYNYDVKAIEGDWSGVAKELANQDGSFGVSLNNFSGVSGIAVVLFYDSSADKAAGKPMAAMILMKD